MSVVAAKVYDDKIEISADSIMTNMWSKENKNFVKLYECNDMIVGAAGPCEEIGIMQKFMSSHKPVVNTERGILEYIIEFSKWKQELIGNNEIGCVYLLIYDSKLYHIEHFWVREILDFCSIGAGQDFANTALHLGHCPEDAVKVTCELCCFVTEPVISMSAKRTKPKFDKETK